MVQILDEGRPSFGQRISQGIGQGLNMLNQQQQQQAELEALQKLTGKNLAGLSREDRSLALKQAFDIERMQEEYGLKQLLEGSKKGKEKPNYQGALDVVNQMRDIRKRGNLGRASSFWGLAGGESAKDRGNYEQLGKSLISFATTIPIRNKLEFETLAEKLYNPNITDAEAEGVLDAMEMIIKNTAGMEDDSSRGSGQTPSKTKNLKPLKSFALG